MGRLAPFRRVTKFAECFDLTEGNRRRLVRMVLECRHEIYRHDEEAQAHQRQRCEDCLRGKPPKNSKAALASWGL